GGGFLGDGAAEQHAPVGDQFGGVGERAGQVAAYQFGVEALSARHQFSASARRSCRVLSTCSNTATCTVSGGSPRCSAAAAGATNWAWPLSWTSVLLLRS